MFKLINVGWSIAGLLFGAACGNLAPAQEDGFRVLFDGSTLASWRGYHQEQIGTGWKIEDGNLHFDGTGGGDVVTRDEFENFELRFEWKVSGGANSGVMYKVRMGDDASYLSGPEYQILDNAKHPNGNDGKTSAASLYGLYAPQNGAPRDAGQWNDAAIMVVGNRIEHWLNGKKVVEVVLGSDDWNQRVANSKFKDWKQFAQSKRGRICLQDHGDEVWFRNIRIKAFKSSGSSSR